MTVLKKIISTAVTTVFSVVILTSCAAAHIEKSQGLVLNVPDDVFPIVKVETSTDSDNIFRISELGSVEAAKKTGLEYHGAGWIFSISKVSENALHKILQNDASGTELFAYKDGNYYLYRHPTDVRFVRENNEAMHRDLPVWSKANEWGYAKVRQSFVTENGLTPVTADNSDVGIGIAKIMYDKNSKATVTSLAAGEFKIDGKSAQNYLKNLLYDAKYTMTDESEPDGEYIVLHLPEEKLYLRFYCNTAKKNYVGRVYENDKPLLFKADCLYAKYPVTEIAKLYQALADKAGKSTVASGDSFLGDWYESVAGRGHIAIKKVFDTYKINIKWGESAYSTAFWDMTAKFENGALVYSDAEYKSVAYNEKDGEKVTPHYKNGKGQFKILASGELLWKDETGGAGNDSVFIKN